MGAYRYKLAFTTLACPNWSWDMIVDRAAEYGYEGIEPRGVEGEMDLTKARPFIRENLSNTKNQLKEHGLEIPCLDTSARFDDPETIDRNIEEARRHIDLAAELDAPYIRVFGDRIPSPELAPKTIAQVAEALNKLGEYTQGIPVMILIETHGDFSKTDYMVELLSQIQSQSIGVLWDIHHPYRFQGETLESTFNRISKYIRHTHVKDSVMTENGPTYWPVGQGDLPLRSALELLRDHNYSGWISFEWEKRWHPEIEEPDVVLPHFVQVIHEIENSLG